MKQSLRMVALAMSAVLQMSNGLPLEQLMALGFDQVFEASTTVSEQTFTIENHIICQVKYRDLPWAVLCNSTSGIKADQFNAGKLTNFSSYAGVAINGDSVESLVNETAVSLYFGTSIPEIGAFPGKEVNLDNGTEFIVSPQKLMDEGFCMTDMFPDTIPFNILKSILDAAEMDGCLNITDIKIDAETLGGSTAMEFAWSLFGETQVFNFGKLIYSLQVSGSTPNGRLLEDMPVDEEGNFNFGSFAVSESTRTPTTSSQNTTTSSPTSCSLVLQEGILLLTTVLLALVAQ